MTPGAKFAALPPERPADAERDAWALIRAVLDGDELARRYILGSAPLRDLADELSVIAASAVRRFTAAEGGIPESQANRLASEKITEALAP